ncbi:MAG: TonB family protein [Gemmatimonadaceae bacterium]
MFGKLLESHSEPSRSKRGLAASAAAHLGVIGLAIYGTASATIPDDRPTERTIHWVETTLAPTPRHSASAPSVAPTSRNSDPVASPVPAISVAINPAIPDVKLQLGAIGNSDFDTPALAGVRGDSSGSSSIVSASGVAAYDAIEVDTPASLRAGGYAPEYPVSLRNARIEGSVTLQFVVDKEGRARAGSERILASTNELFAATVLRSLPQMRFVPARIGNRPVAQTVQQLFAFRLDR